MKKTLLTIMLAVLAASYFQVSAQDITGKWKTIDDETGKPKSIVEISIKDGKLYGTIVKLFREPGEELDPICDDCTDYRKDKKIIGMQIVTGLEKDGNYWEGDDGILDPKNGKIYDCKLWLEDKNTLSVRGYISFLYRTQTWYRAD